MRDMEREPQKLSGGFTYASAQTLVSVPKENVLESAPYEAAVRKLPCARCGIVGFTQFCHADMGKGMGIKTDVRRGWAGCGPHDTMPGCHWVIGTSGQIQRAARRILEAGYAAWTRAEVLRRGWWPKKLPEWTES